VFFSYKILNNKTNIVSEDICFAHTVDEFKEIIKSNSNLMLISFKKKNIRLDKTYFSANFTLPFLRCLHTLVSNAIDISSALKITKQSFKKNEYKAIVAYITYMISSGYSFHYGLQNTGFFDGVLTKSIEIAEKTATLPKSLEYIIRYMEENLETLKLVKNSLTYPIILLFTILFVTLFWIFFIIPNFIESFEEMKISVSFFTKSLLNFRNFCIKHAIFTLVFLFFINVWIYLKRKKILQKIPIIKNINRDIIIFRFFLSMNLLLSEKINFTETLRISLSSINNDIFRKKIEETVNSIQNGCNILTAFKKTKIFTDQEMAIIDSGEKSGNIIESFKIVSEILKRNTIHSINKTTSLLQPLFTVAMGLILIVMIYLVFLPIYDQVSVQM
jgi:type II secretory pathway component PulF